MILNEQQLKAVYAKEQNIFLLAGAGSGKTRVIIERIKRLIKEDMARPNDILCLTFTKKAADEMQHRLNDLVQVYTFHGFAYDVLSKYEVLSIIDDNIPFTTKELLDISNYKNSYYQLRKPKQYDAYQMFLKSQNKVDFDDLIIRVIPRIKKHAFKYIFIDEFQDTNLIQFKLIESLMTNDIKIFAVGDPDQSIYAFRGARQDLMILFLKQKKFYVYKLEKNYRSTPHILSAANKFISKDMNRMKKRLTATKLMGHKPYIFLEKNKFWYKKVIACIKESRSSDVAVLYRNHKQLQNLPQILEDHYIFGVHFLTFHESKGLEFDCCILLDASVMPLNRDLTYRQECEERRLLFVAMTRAKNHLYIFSSRPTKFLNQTGISYVKL